MVLAAYFKSKGVHSKQSEARINLQYLASLANAYSLEYSNFVYFDEPYGAREVAGGSPHCKPPEGANTLGFEIRHCDSVEETKIKRYTFRLMPKESAPGFIATATSGVDTEGVDLVCGSVDEKDVWQIDEARTLVHLKACEK